MTEAVTDLVRGTLCPALKAIFQHGLKKPSILGGPCHPWLFLEEVTFDSKKLGAVHSCGIRFLHSPTGFLSGGQQRGGEGL